MLIGSISPFTTWRDTIGQYSNALMPCPPLREGFEVSHRVDDCRRGSRPVRPEEARMGACAFAAELAAALSTRAAAYRAAQAARPQARRSQRKPYERIYFPGLRDALMLNACRHAASRSAAAAHVARRAQSHRPLRLGKGAPPSDWRAVRKARCAALPWIKRHAVQKKASSSQITSSLPSIVPRSALPDDVRRARAACFRRSRGPAPLFPRPPPPVWRPPLCTVLDDDAGYRQHVTRAADGLEHRLYGLRPQGGPKAGGVTSVPFDAAAEAAAAMERYAGRPDELYRRRMGRRFAAHRREQRSLAERAEREMRRRRGSDRTQSGRRAGDTSFVPFAFAQPDGAFFFSNSITQARQTMLAKYTAPMPQAVAAPLEGRDKAVQAAHEKALFHTRVHNRFA